MSITSPLGHPHGFDSQSTSVIIINYNTYKELEACLESVRPEAASQVVVVDNDSSDGSVEMVRCRYPWVTLLANKTNVGYGAAANQAFASCTARYVLLLNSDTLLQPGALEALSRYLDQHPRAAIAGPRLVNTDGTLQESCYPYAGTFEWCFDNDAWLSLIRLVPVLRDRCLRTWSHDSPRIVPCVKGAALMIRREAFNAVGGFDETFFMYFEEMDLCRRLVSTGWEIHFTPVTTILHIGESSTKQFSADMTVQFAVSNLSFCERHHPKIWFAGLKMIMSGTILARFIRDSIRLRLVRDKSQCATISAQVEAWKRLLFGL